MINTKRNTKRNAKRNTKKQNKKTQKQKGGVLMAFELKLKSGFTQPKFNFSYTTTDNITYTIYTTTHCFKHLDSFGINPELRNAYNNLAQNNTTIVLNTPFFLDKVKDLLTKMNLTNDDLINAVPLNKPHIKNKNLRKITKEIEIDGVNIFIQIWISNVDGVTHTMFLNSLFKVDDQEVRLSHDNKKFGDNNTTKSHDYYSTNLYPGVGIDYQVPKTKTPTVKFTQKQLTKPQIRQSTIISHINPTKKQKSLTPKTPTEVVQERNRVKLAAIKREIKNYREKLRSTKTMDGKVTYTELVNLRDELKHQLAAKNFVPNTSEKQIIYGTYEQDPSIIDKIQHALQAKREEQGYVNKSQYIKIVIDTFTRIASETAGTKKTEINTHIKTLKQKPSKKV